MLNLFHQQDCECCDPRGTLSEAIAPDVQSNKTRRLSIALALITGFAIAEVGVGWLSHSLALVAESIHMVSDCGALAIALFAAWLEQRTIQKNGGVGLKHYRIEAWAALINGGGLLLIALWILQEATTHLQSPAEEILSIPMLLTAIVGFGINTLNASLLHGHSHDDLNLRGAFLHMVADAASSVGVILAAIAVAVWGWTWADSLTSMLVALLIIVGSVPLIVQSISALTTKPAPFPSVNEIQQILQTLDGVIAVEIHSELANSSEKGSLVHITLRTANTEVGDRLQQQAYQILDARWSIPENTVQITVIPQPPLMNLSIPSNLEILTSNS